MLGTSNHKVGQTHSNRYLNSVFAPSGLGDRGPLAHQRQTWLPLIVMLLSFGLFRSPLFSQEDWNVFQRLEQRIKTLERKVEADSVRLAQDEKSTFYLYKYLHVADTNAPALRFTGYLDAYYAIYSDSVTSEFQKFPTSSPRKNQFGLNMLYLAANYVGKHARANVGLHFGDIASSAWSERFNLIQEANLGIKLHKRIWLDGGFFRTHLGMESIQPRENITQSIAVTTYFEPYFLSGLKFTYLASDKLSLQLSTFNGFNTFVETNRNKAIGASAVYVFNEKSLLSINALYSDESPNSQSYRQPRLYSDAYYVYRGPKVEFGAEANFGIQARSDLQDSTQAALMYSFILAAKYKMGKVGVYGRAEMFEDSNEMLTGPIENANHQLVGINTVGGTLGTELKPLPNTFLRVESRYLHASDRETIFYRQGRYYHHRWEGIAALGVWF